MRGKTKSESLVRHFELTSLFCCLLLSFALGTIAATNLDATFDRINDDIEEMKWHVERLRQLCRELPEGRGGLP